MSTAWQWRMVLNVIMPANKKHSAKRGGGDVVLRHYITQYAEGGIKYAEAWLQFNIFNHCFCFMRRKIRLHE